MKHFRTSQVFITGIRFLSIVFLVVFQFGLTLSAASAQGGGNSPSIRADTLWNYVLGFDWPEGDIVTLTVDDPSTLTYPDYTATDTVDYGSFWDPNYLLAEFDLEGVLTLEPGFVLVMTNGVITQTMTLLNVEVTSIDLSTEVISGTSPAGMQVDVSSGNGRRHATASSEGQWTVDFSVPGPLEDEQNLVNILGDMDGSAEVSDVNNNKTIAGWIAWLPYMSVNIDDYQVDTRGWPVAGATLTLTINGSDMEYTSQVEKEGRSPAATKAAFNLPTDIQQLKEGDVVTITDGTTTLSYTLSNTQVTNVDAEADTVSGISTPGALMDVWTDTGGCCTGRMVTVDETGHWMADFQNPGYHPDPNQHPTTPIDLQSGSVGQALEINSAGYKPGLGNGTKVNWSYPFNIPPVANAGEDQIIPVGSTITLDASASYDIDGAISGYAWDLDNDGKYDNAGGVTTEMSFPEVGTFVIGLILWDDGGKIDTDTVTITVTAPLSPVLRLVDSTGNGLSGGTAQYYDGSWKNIPGSTDSSGVLNTDLENLHGNISFRMTYEGGSNDIRQNVTDNPFVTFQTANATVQLQDHSGSPLDTGTVQYFAGSWRNFGTTLNGQVSKELLPKTYTFRMAYAGGSLDQAQDIGSDPNVTFQTANVTVRLQDHAGSPLDTGTVQYYAGSWRDFGITSGGQASKELLPKTYTFRMAYAGGSLDQAQDIGSDPTVTFQTANVTVQLQDHAGSPLDTGTVQYYAGSWRDFGTTSNGQASKELLPKTYTFRMAYAGGSIDLAQNVAADPAVTFQTGQVHSDSSTAVRYYAGSWLAFQQDMELLPKSYSFRFNDQTPDTKYTILPVVMNHIH